MEKPMNCSQREYSVEKRAPKTYLVMELFFVKYFDLLQVRHSRLRGNDGQFAGMTARSG